MKKVTIYTQVYNTKPYLVQCINSVLAQTYTNFEFLLVDNGCTDGSSEIIDLYAAQDSRIHAIHYAKNCGPRFEVVRRYATGEYYTTLDSDDWWEFDYLEDLVSFAEKYNLDLAITGAYSYFEATGQEQILRKLDDPVILTPEQFAQDYPRYWTFPSAYWASITRTKFYCMEVLEQFAKTTRGYGADTVTMIELIKSCRLIGINDRALYHYRIRKNAISYCYKPNRLAANVHYYQQSERFLIAYHTLDNSKKLWLERVYLSSLAETVRLLDKSGLPPQEKGNECVHIASHPLTVKTLKSTPIAETQALRDTLLTILLKSASQCEDIENDFIAKAVGHLIAICKGAVWAENAGLYLRETELYRALLDDDAMGLMDKLLILISQKKYSKQYDLGKIAQGLNPKGSLLHEVADTRFIREHLEIYQMLYREERLQALDAMTGLLLEGKRLYGREQFLKLYLSVAALEEQIPAFLFGKEQLALLLYEEARLEECREILSELAEMGVEDSEVIVAIKQALEGAT